MKAPDEDLPEQVPGPENLRAAWLAAKANRGAAGVDGIGTGETAAHPHRHWRSIGEKLPAGTYGPAPARPVRMPKPGGGERRPGIPTTTGRPVQQALLRKPSPIPEPGSGDRSHAHRPGRSAHDAARAAKRHVVEEQRRFVADIDIEGLFDNLDHDLPVRDLAPRVGDKRVPELIGQVPARLPAPTDFVDALL